MTVGGATHFLAPGAYAAVIPRPLGAARPWVYASGVVEVACGLLLARPGTRRFGGALTAVVLVAVYPANVKMALDDGGLWWARLPLQLPLVWWAWREARTPQPRRARICATSSAAEVGTP